MAAPIADALRDVLNNKGYGFQFAVLNYCRQVSQRWEAVVTEYPVDLHDAPVHIDFVLSCTGKPHLLVAECKHADQWTWGFARGIRSWSAWKERPRADYLQWTVSTSWLMRDPHAFVGPNPYNIAVEYSNRHQKHSEEQKKIPRAFEQALTQVLHGRAGLLNDLYNRKAKEYDRCAVVPVIFTTASLVATDTELSRADFKTGRITEMAGEKKEWLCSTITSPLVCDRPCRPHLVIVMMREIFYLRSIAT